MQIDNVLFDLGGVLYEIAPDKMQNAFLQLGEKYGASLSRPEIFAVFEDMERGLFGEAEFFDALRSAADMPATDDELRAAWNAVLVGPYSYAARLSAAAAVGRRVALLSNTNLLHYRQFITETQAIFAPMERLFFSFEIGRRKPDRTAFEFVVESMSLAPERTLFVDDSLVNVEAARRMGFRVYHATAPQKMVADLSAWLTLPDPKI
ncbi:MAG: HAD-IA family hydrolase [Bacteroidia bacterium]|nr:HAD-IA family hydrolase [Bacteroidia bacterium]MDW8333258.1 HAD-IA family hydrolase [Bacteroidia bacterium]